MAIYMKNGIEFDVMESLSCALDNFLECISIDILVSLSLKRMNCILDHCTYVHGLALLLLC